MGDGAQLKDWILLIAGNIFIAILAVRALGYYAKREWGEMVGHLIGGIFVAGFIYFPDESINLFKALWKMLFPDQAA